MGDEPTLTLADDTEASHPGGVKLQVLRWLRHYPKWPLVLAGGLIASVVACTYAVDGAVDGVPPEFGAIVFGGLGVGLWIANRLYWVRQREHFLHGCANPGIIVSTSPLRYAVLTDLSKGFGKFPVIMIRTKRFATVLEPAAVGNRIATVALYSTDDEPLPHWIGFDPIPVDCATRNAAAVRRVLATIDETDWDELERGLAELPRPLPPGIYPVETGGSDWARLQTASKLVFED